MAKRTEALVSNEYSNEQFKIAVSHDIKEVLIKVIDLIITLNSPTATTVKQ